MIMVHMLCIALASILAFRFVFIPVIYRYQNDAANAANLCVKGTCLYAGGVCLTILLYYFVENGALTEAWRNLLFTLLTNGIFLAMAIADISVRKIPNRLCVYLAILGSFVIPAQLSDYPIQLIFSAAVICICLVLSLSAGIGGGDLKMLMAAAVPLRMTVYVSSLFWASVVIVITACIGFAIGKLNRKSPIPFAPFMAAGVFIATCRTPLVHSFGL